MELFPPMPLAEWQGTKETLHRFEQVVGKLRLAGSARRNHWWNVPFYLTGRGVTTRPTGLADGHQVFTVDFDFVSHQLAVTALEGKTVSFPLYGQSVASFQRELWDALAALGVEVEVPLPKPFGLPDTGRPFAEDTEHATYDPLSANRWWRILSQVALVLEEFATRFSGKASPVHHFWHTFDLAHSRFSGRAAEPAPKADPVTREAYSREVISFGFWFGDEGFPHPAFYSYTAPEPAGLAGELLVPDAARWMAQDGGHLAVLPYDAARAEPDPRGAALAFYESAYQAGAGHAGWDVAGLTSLGGITDQKLRAAASAPRGRG